MPEFFISLVSAPVYTTMPMIQSVFLSIAPRSSNCLADNASGFSPSAMLPENEYRFSSGGPNFRVPIKTKPSPVPIKFWVSLSANFGFKFFSPSRVEVIMNALPFESDELSSTMSAGKNSSSSILTISPTNRSFHSVSYHLPSLYFFVFVEFVSRSALYLERSSNASRIMESETTKIKGAIADIGLSGEMAGIDCRMATRRK